MEYEEIKSEVNNLSNVDLEDLSTYIETLLDARELDRDKSEEK
ncbi:MAG: hypothetical protein AABY22_21510 [Nanoarchaeota archaeon]